MPSKWEFQDALMASALPGPAKCIGLVISTRADVETGVVPEQFSPSLDELADLSGFSTATVKRHLGALESQGWVKRVRSFGSRNGYAVAIPSTGSERAITQSGIAHSEPAQSELIDGSERSVDQVTVSQPYKEVHQTHLSDQEPFSSAEPPRLDVERICRHLAERMIANGCKPPSIGKKWRDAARLLLDKDGRTEAQVITAIDWATTDAFWKANILSLPTLRERYDQLRLAAQRERAGARASPDRPSVSDARAAAAIDRGRALKAQREAQALQGQQPPREISS